MIGKTILHYQILEKIGQGGMGVLYLAEDLRLDRKVALKFLTSVIAASEQDRNRFTTEAKAAAALNHANIAIIYTIEAYEGQLFIVMEYVDGRELKDIINADDGALLAIDDILDYGIQIAGGLLAAHQKGIIHRDIKPANIMVTDAGSIKILDFGLAKLKGSSELTVAGTTLGTVAYMSPEQSQGLPVDQRTDIWAFGVVLYVTLTGKMPFKGDYSQALMYAIINEDPEPVQHLRKEIPDSLASIIERCLQKDVDARYPRMQDVLDDLEAVKAGASVAIHIPAVTPDAPLPPDKTSERSTRYKWPFLAAGLAVIILLAFIFWPGGVSEKKSSRTMLAVLPFENYGPPEDAYFSAGIANAINTRIASIAGIGTISRRSANQYRKRDKSIQQIGKELGVDYLLDGTVQREHPGDATSRVQIVPQLVRVADDNSIWTETYDRDINVVFQMQSEIAERVAQALDIALLAPERQAIERRPTQNLAAYDAYLRGNDFASRDVVEADAEQAVLQFQKAVALDSTFAGAYAALAKSQAWLSWQFGHMEALPKARTALDQAVKLAPDQPETQLAQGFYDYWGSRDYDKALGYFQNVQKRYPNYADAIEAMGYIYRRQGKWDEAVRHLEMAARLDPRNYFTLSNLGDNYFLMRNYAESERFLNRAVALRPDIAFAYTVLLEMYVSRDGNTQLARQTLDNAQQHIDPPQLAANWVYLKKIDGRYNDALGHLQQPYDSLFYYLDKADLYQLMGKTQQSRLLYDSAAVNFRRKVQQYPDIAVYHAGLGLALAGLGHIDAAVQEADKAVSLVPLKSDAYTGAVWLELQAWTLMKVGQHAAAIEKLRLLLSRPSRLSAEKIKIEPNWRPLKNHPGYPDLLKNM